jgi:hypothetical protein
MKNSRIPFNHQPNGVGKVILEFKGKFKYGAQGGTVIR